MTHAMIDEVVAGYANTARLAEEWGLDGVELWSVLTDAAEAWRTPAEAVRWLRNPEAAVAAGPPAHHLALWDALSARRRVPAIGGLDDHSEASGFVAGSARRCRTGGPSISCGPDWSATAP